MSAEGNFLVLGLDGTVISSGGDLQGDDRFVTLALVNDSCKFVMGVTLDFMLLVIRRRICPL